MLSKICYQRVSVFKDLYTYKGIILHSTPVSISHSTWWMGPWFLHLLHLSKVAWYACLKCHWCYWHWYVCMLDDLSTAGVAQVACRNLDMGWSEAGYFSQLVVSVLAWCCFLALAVHLVQPFLPRFSHGMSFAGHKLWMSWPSSTAITVLPLYSILVPVCWFPIFLLAFLYM